MIDAAPSLEVHATGNPDPHSRVDAVAHEVIHARQYSIAGGTNEIQRNIIGECVLGLPKS